MAYNFKIAIFKLIFVQKKQKKKKNFRLRKILENRSIKDSLWSFFEAFEYSLSQNCWTLLI